MSVTESWLSTWFINNYIRKCSEFWPEKVSRLFNDISTSIKLQNPVSVAINWRPDAVLGNVLNEFGFEVWDIPDSLAKSSDSMTPRSCACLMRELAKLDSRLYVYFTAVTFLHIAYKIPMLGFNDELMDVLATILGQNIGPRRYSSQHSSVVLLSRSTRLMKVIANNSRSTVQLIEIELSKAYLHRALRCRDSESSFIYLVANVYLAVLYYITGQYQKATDHCTLATWSQDQSHSSLDVLLGKVLPRIDDTTDNVLGLVVFYQYVCTAVLKQQQRQQQERYYVCLLTAEAFAHYLHIRSLHMSVTNCCQFTQTTPAYETERYKSYITNTQQPLHIADMLLLKRVNNNLYNGKSAYKPLTHMMNTTELNTTSELVELLQKSAVEHLTAFRQLEARDFQSIITIVTTDFKALYAYRHGDYRYCLQLSTQNVNTLRDTTRLTSFWIHAWFIQLMDDDVVSLIALMSIINPKYRSSSNQTSIDQLTPSLYLMTQCQLKLGHSPVQLAKTLEYIEDRLRICPAKVTFVYYTLKLIKCKVATQLITLA